MLNAFLLSSCVFSGLFATLLIANVSEKRLGLVSYLSSPSQAIAELVFSNVVATTNVDRSRKGDRLPMNHGVPATNTKIVPKVALPPNHSVQCANATSGCQEPLEIDEKKRAPNPEPAPPIDCEELASPASDPSLTRFIGRCFA
jgi:hypothetical protein